MTPDEMIEVITAFKEGKTIQVKSFDCQWVDCSGNKPNWNFGERKYRVKPEPREFYLALNSNGSVRHACRYHAQSIFELEYIKVREVIE